MRVTFAEDLKVIWGAEPKSYSGLAMTAKWVSLKNYARLTIVITTGAWAAGTAAVTLLQATAVAGTGSKALAIPAHWHDEAASGALVKVATVSNTFNLTTANRMYVVEVDPATLDIANGFDCVSLAVASPGANADFYSVAYYLSGARYAGQIPASPIVD
jgi:hypothetical protein